MKRAVNKNKVQLGFIILVSLTLLPAFGCKEAPTLAEFLEMHPAEADLLDVGARYQVIQDILWLLDDPVGDSGMRLLDITFGDHNPYAEFSETAHDGASLISVYLTERPWDMKGLKPGEIPFTDGPFIDLDEISIPDIDETAAEKVRLTFDFYAGEIPWGTEALDGLFGYSEMEILGILADFAAPTIQTALARYTDTTEVSVRVVRAEGAPFLASYDHAVGELALNPNYLHLVSLLPQSALSLLAENSTTGLKEFELCVDYVSIKAFELFYEDLFDSPDCDEEGIIEGIACIFAWMIFNAIIIVFVYSFFYVLLYPILAIPCIHFIFNCGTIASSTAGTLPLAGLVLLPLAFIKIITRVRNQRSGQPQDREGWTAKAKKSRLAPPVLYSLFLVTFVIVLLCVIFLSSSDAMAESVIQDEPIASLLRDEKDFGINAAFGGPALIGGLQLGFNPHARIGLDVGVGISAAPTVYLESKYYFMSKNFTPYAGLGAAYWAIPFFGWPISTVYIYPTLGVQYMFDNGLSLSLHGDAFIGASTGVVFPYGGLTIGWYF